MQKEKIWYKKWWGVMILFLLFMLFSVLSASGIYIITKIREYQKNPVENSLKLELKSADLLKKIEGKAALSSGTDQAKITIVEFGDFTCPYCKELYPVMKYIRENYAENTKIIYRDFPVVSDNSLIFSLAARCSAEKGKFWKMHDLFFSADPPSDLDELTLLAGSLGISESWFKYCVKNEKYLKAVQSDYADGLDLGVSGTPTLFINGNKIQGNVPLEFMVKIIEDNIH